MKSILPALVAGLALIGAFGCAPAIQSTTDRPATVLGAPHSSAPAPLLATPAYVTFAPTTPALYFSPFNSWSDGRGPIAANNVLPSSSYVEWNNPGAYLKFKVTLVTPGDVRLILDTSTQNGMTPASCQEIAFRRPSDLGNRVYRTVYSPSPVEVNLGTALPVGDYEFFVYLKGQGYRGINGEVWAARSNVIRIRGVKVPEDATLSLPNLKHKRAVIFGDSHTTGNLVFSASGTSADQDAGLTWVPFAMAALDCEYGVMAFSGQGYTQGIDGKAASATHPSLYNAVADNQSWDKYHSGASWVAVAGQPPPDYVINRHGQNDPSLTPSTVAAWIAAVRGTRVTSKSQIFCIANLMLTRASALQEGVAVAADPNAFYGGRSTALYHSGPPGTVYSNEGAASGYSGHPNAAGQRIDADVVTAVVMKRRAESKP